MLTRQLAVAIAAGLHPFDFREIAPHRVLLIDCENSERQSRRKFAELAPLSIRYQRRVPDRALILIHRPAGLDLTRDEDAAWLRERAWAHRPDVLVIGPFYRLHMSDMNDELPARKVAAVLDQIRTKMSCALIIEAHSGHGEAGGKRAVRPVGSSLLLRWPEFGYGLVPVSAEDTTLVELRPWRGARDERAWPTRLRWGGEGHWPWRAEDVT
jgi:RecA-family ATPase